MTNQVFETAYPHLARWIEVFGWLTIGHDDYSRSFIRVIDEGGMIWESEESYPSLDDALNAADRAVAEWMESQGLA